MVTLLMTLSDSSHPKSPLSLGPRAQLLTAILLCNKVASYLIHSLLMTVSNTGYILPSKQFKHTENWLSLCRIDIVLCTAVQGFAASVGRGREEKVQAKATCSKPQLVLHGCQMSRCVFCFHGLCYDRML